MNKAMRAFYEANPLLVSSPFGGIDGVNRELLLDVFARLDVDLRDRAVLDVGCGRGFIGEIVAEQGGTYTGIDLVISGDGFRLAQADAIALPFSDASFDVLLCFDAFEHFPEPLRAAREFRRVLKPGGCFFLSAPNYANVAGIVKRVYEGLGWYAPNTWAPFRRWQPQELETFVTARGIGRIMRAADFTHARCIGHGQEVGLGLFPWIDHAKMPDAIRFRLQRLFGAIGPGVARAWPGASLHLFWNFE